MSKQKEVEKNPFISIFAELARPKPSYPIVAERETVAPFGFRHSLQKEENKEKNEEVDNFILELIKENKEMQMYPTSTVMKSVYSKYKKLSSAFVPDRDFFAKNFPNQKVVFVPTGNSYEDDSELMLKPENDKILFVIPRNLQDKNAMRFHQVIMYNAIKRLQNSLGLALLCEFVTVIVSIRGKAYFLTSSQSGDSMVTTITDFIRNKKECEICFEDTELEQWGCIFCKKTICTDCSKKIDKCSHCQTPIKDRVVIDHSLYDIWLKLLLRSLNYC